MKDKDARWCVEVEDCEESRSQLSGGRKCVVCGRYEYRKYEYSTYSRRSTRKYKGTAEQVGFRSQMQYESLIGLQLGEQG